MKWYQLQVIIKGEAQEAVAEYLCRKGSPGITIEDSFPPSLPEGGDIMYSPGDYSRDLVSVKGYFLVQEKELEGLRRELSEFLKGLSHYGLYPGEFVVQSQQIKEEDWAESWKAHFHPVRISNSLVITPSWIDYEPQGAERVVKLDPGMAFGCGTHPTTRMCLETLAQGSLEGARVYDLGCGSGILSIAAVKLGAGEAIALDNDEMALGVARENCRINQVKDRVKIYRGKLPHFFRDRGPLPPGDLILANISYEIIRESLAGIKGICRKSSRVILTGILVSKGDLIKENLHRAGYTLQEIRREGDWIALTCIPGE